MSVPVGSRLHEELLIWADHVGAGRSGKRGQRRDRVLIHPLTSAKLLCLLQPISLAENGLDCMKRFKKKKTPGLHRGNLLSHLMLNTG